MPEETTYIKQGVGLRKGMITVNGWYAGGKVGGGGGREVGQRGGSVFSQWGKTSVQTNPIVT